MPFSLFCTAIGECAIAWNDGGDIVATHLPEASSAATAARIARRTGASEGAPPHAVRRAIVAITTLLEGEKTDLRFIVCDVSNIDAFARRVYAAAREIAPGETLTYGAIATQLGDKSLAQSVGRALGRNPFPIIVPCHRVLGAGGKLTGFSARGGVETKLKMLAIEGANIAAAPSLFDDLPLATKPQQ